jgi:hypothetical protein
MAGLIVILVAAGAAWAKDYEVKKKAGDYSVVVRIDRNPPVVGENNARIKVEEAGGRHVTDAKVVVHYGMAAMPGMPPMNYKTDAQVREDWYHAKMNLSMAGPWNIEVKITRGGKSHAMKFTVDAK